MSNSGTTTSFFAVFIRSPKPVFAVVFSVLVSEAIATLSLPLVSKGDKPLAIVAPLATLSTGGEGARVGGNEGSSMSMIIELRWRRAKDLRSVGDAGGRLVETDRSRTGDSLGRTFASDTSSRRSSSVSAISFGCIGAANTGRSKDHDRTRSMARTWQPEFGCISDEPNCAYLKQPTHAA